MGYPEMKLSIVHVQVPGIYIVDVDHTRIPEGFACVVRLVTPASQGRRHRAFCQRPGLHHTFQEFKGFALKLLLLSMVPAFILITPNP